MNQKQKYINRQETLDKVKRSSIYATRLGCVKIWKGNSFQHEFVKCQIAIKLLNQGYDFIPEPEFKDGGRADLLVIDQNGYGTAIEVLHTETEERFQAKQEVYPFPIIKVETKDFDIDKWDF